MNEWPKTTLFQPKGFSATLCSAPPPPWYTNLPVIRSLCCLLESIEPLLRFWFLKSNRHPRINTYNVWHRTLRLSQTHPGSYRDDGDKGSLHCRQPHGVPPVPNLPLRAAPHRATGSPHPQCLSPGNCHLEDQSPVTVQIPTLASDKRSQAPDPNQKLGFSPSPVLSGSMLPLWVVGGVGVGMGE